MPRRLALMLSLLLLAATPAPADPVCKMDQVGGIVRPSGPTGWIIQDDQYHTPEGLYDVYVWDSPVFGPVLRVVFSSNFTQITTVYANTDDDLALAGISAHTSAGLSALVITLMMDGAQLDPAEVAGIVGLGTGNLWVNARGSRCVETKRPDVDD